MKIHFSKTLLVMISLLLSVDAKCQLHFTELKGLDANILLKPEYDYLHPIRGFALAKQGILSNLYNYPNSENSKKISDPTESFIQNVFNTAQGSDSPTFFQVSPLAEKFGR